MEKTIKVTKAQVLEAVKVLMETEADGVQVGEVVVTPADIVAYCDTTIAQLQAKAVKAAETAKKKRQTGDEMREAILAVVTDEFQDVDTITAQVDFEDVTRSKVVARMKQLVEDQLVVKGEIKVGKSKKVAYKLADQDEATSAE